jgi:hypothetical protein
MQISALALTMGLLFSLSLPGIAQDSAQLAKIEYEMAEASLAAKEYGEVSGHLSKAIKFLGKTNFKIEYLRLQNMLDYINNPGTSETEVKRWQLTLNRDAQKLLKEYANTDNKEKYGDVYRIVSSLEPKAKETEKEYDGLYNNYRDYKRTIDSLDFLKKESPFEQKRSLDTIWRLGRTYAAITSHYKNAIVKRLNYAITSVDGKDFTAEIYNRTNFTIPIKYKIENLQMILPQTGEISYAGEVYIPYSAWFNKDDRLFAIKYLHKNKRTGKFWQPVENTWASKEQDGRYIATSSMVIEYFADDKQSGVLLVLPYSKLDGADADGNNWKSFTINSSEPEMMADKRNFFYCVYGYLPALHLSIKNAAGDKKGALLTKVGEGGNGALAGLKENDIITRVGYSRIYSLNQFFDAMLLYSPGEIIEIDYYRDGTQQTTKATIGKM